ncbi:MAG TPA: BMP family ABC transporter substrate-binding protein [Candidatus Fimivicinus intestinavium]|nr:BMP family ABC transporter substrate-binding protein [Candidatus Fimivicinus intestinavium]
MKKFTKALALLMAFALVFALAACSGGGDTGEPSGNEPAASGSTFPAVPKEEIKVGVIHIGNPNDTAGYTHAHDIGIVAMQNQLGLGEEQIIRKNDIDDTDKTAIETAIRECIEAGCHIIFGTSYGYMDTMEQLAAEYPDVIFSHCSGYKNNGKNLNNYFGRIYEARYLTGIAAGLKTQSNKIGYVAAQGSDNPEVTGGIDAFALGVKSVNPDAKIYVKVTNTWFDPQKEKSAAIALLDEGCDVIAQHQDTAQPQIAAQERGVWGCGYNSDMTAEAPKAHLTATIWNWGVYYTQAVQQVIDGTWTPTNYFDGMKEGLVGISPLSANCADGTQEAIDKAQAGILDGTLKVFAGPIKDASGTERVKSGDYLKDDYIAGQLNWYVDNVVADQ